MYFLVFLVISYAKNGKTALEIAQRKKHRGVVRYLSKPPTGKISVEGNGGAGVFKQGMGSKTEAPCDKIIAGGEKLSLGEPHSMSGRRSKTQAAYDKVIAGESQCTKGVPRGHRWNPCCSLRCNII